jgi:hypothetical protein
LIACDLLVKPFDGNAIELRKVGVEDDPLMAKKQNPRFYGDRRGPMVFCPLT